MARAALSLWLGMLALSRVCMVASLASLAFNRPVFTESRAPQSVSDPFIQAAATLAVQELQLLSDSGVYTTLSLHKVLDASTQARPDVLQPVLLGDFHYVTHLRVALSSPHFASREPLETFDMMVLERKAAPPSAGVGPGADEAEHKPLSIAIDEFPVMDEDAIEQFWVRKVEDRRRRRRELFAQWEADEREHGRSEVLDEDKTSKRKKKTLLSLEQLEGMPTSELRELLATRASSEQLRVAVSRVIDDRLDKLQRMERDASASKEQKDEL